jgi:hypothetical protein
VSEDAFFPVLDEAFPYALLTNAFKIFFINLAVNCWEPVAFSFDT